MFKNYQLAIIQFCAEECARQGSGEASVAGMVKAYNYACERFAVDNTILVEDLLALADCIEPVKNRSGFRPETIDGQNIEQEIANLLDAQDQVPPTEFYKGLVKIRPFIDGNDRLGAILFNLKKGSLYVPVAAPDVFVKV